MPSWPDAWQISTEGLAGGEETRLKFGANPVGKRRSEGDQQQQRLSLEARLQRHSRSNLPPQPQPGKPGRRQKNAWLALWVAVQQIIP